MLFRSEAVGLEDSDQEEEDMHVLQEQIYRNCCQILQDDFSHCVLELSHRRLNYAAGFIYCDCLALERSLTEAQYIQMIHRHVGVSLQREIRLLVGKKVPDIEMIAQSYESVITLKNLEAFRSQKPIYFYEHELHGQEGNTILCKKELDTLVEAIQHGERDRSEEHTSELQSPR